MTDKFFESGVQCERQKYYRAAAEFFFKACKETVSRREAFSHILRLTAKNLIDCSYLEKLILEYNELFDEAEFRAYSDPEISNLFGTLYYFDFEIIEWDLEKAAGFFWNGALRGCADSQYYLGLMHEFGHGVEQDYEEAAKCYRIAYNHGIEEALNGLERLERLEEK